MAKGTTITCAPGPPPDAIALVHRNGMVREGHRHGDAAGGEADAVHGLKHQAARAGKFQGIRIQIKPSDESRSIDYSGWFINCE